MANDNYGKAALAKANSNTTQLAEIATLNYCYNIKHLNGLNAELRRKNNIKNIAIIGDSITEGQKSGSNWRKEGFSGILETKIKELYGDGGYGIVPVWASISPSVLALNSWGSGSGGSYCSVKNADGGFGLIPEKLDVVGARFYFYKFNGGGKQWMEQAPHYEYIQLQNSTEIAATYTMTGWTPSLTQITCRVETNPAKVIGIQPLTSAISGVCVHNLGFSGKNGVDAFNPSGDGINLENLLSLINPVLQIIAFSANDYNNQLSLSSFKTSIKDGVQKAKLRGSKVLLLVNGLWTTEIDSPKSIPHESYENIFYEVATEENISVINVNEMWRNISNVSKTSNYYSDTVHPNYLGHKDIAENIFNLLNR